MKTAPEDASFVTPMRSFSAAAASTASAGSASAASIIAHRRIIVASRILVGARGCGPGRGSARFSPPPVAATAIVAAVRDGLLGDIATEFIAAQRLGGGEERRGVMAHRRHGLRASAQ